MNILSLQIIKTITVLCSYSPVLTFTKERYLVIKKLSYIVDILKF